MTPHIVLNLRSLTWGFGKSITSQPANVLFSVDIFVDLRLVGRNLKGLSAPGLGLRNGRATREYADSIALPIDTYGLSLAVFELLGWL